MKVDNSSWTSFSTQLTSAGFTCSNETVTGLGTGYCGIQKDCATVGKNLSNIVISINGTNLQVTPSGYLVDGTASGWKCVAAVMGGVAKNTEVQFGTYFLANYYAQFNYDNNTVSLAVNSLNSFNTTLVVPSDNSSDDD